MNTALRIDDMVVGAVLKDESSIAATWKNPAIGFALAVSLWSAAVAVGMGFLLHYEYTPSRSGSSSVVWPTESQISRSLTSPTLVMVVHPQCPCTRASIGELARIMAGCQGKLKAIVLFLKPDEFREGWERTDLWRAAENIPGVATIADRNGVEAARFHASTSGQALLYDLKGKLLFSGGITAARGHAGDNDGEDAVLSLVLTGRANDAKSLVFGCSLLDNRPVRERANEYGWR